MKRRKGRNAYVVALVKFFFIVLLLFFSRRVFKLRDEARAVKRPPAMEQHDLRIAHFPDNILVLSATL